MELSSSPASQNVVIRGNNHEHKLFETFGELRRTQKFADLKLHCKLASIPCHRVVLSTFSPYFKRLLEKHWKEPNFTTAMIGMEEKDVNAVLDYMYYGEVALDREGIQGFFKVAKELEITDVNFMAAVSAGEEEEMIEVEVPREGEENSRGFEEPAAPAAVEGNTSSPGGERDPFYEPTSLLDVKMEAEEVNETVDVDFIPLTEDLAPPLPADPLPSPFWGGLVPEEGLSITPVRVVSPPKPKPQPTPNSKVALARVLVPTRVNPPPGSAPGHQQNQVRLHPDFPNNNAVALTVALNDYKKRILGRPSPLKLTLGGAGTIKPGNVAGSDKNGGGHVVIRARLAQPTVAAAQKPGPSKKASEETPQPQPSTSKGTPVAQGGRRGRGPGKRKGSAVTGAAKGSAGKPAPSKKNLLKKK